MPAKDHAGTQGWQRPRQVARPASRGRFCWFNVVFSSDQRVLVLKRTAELLAYSGSYIRDPVQVHHGMTEEALIRAISRDDAPSRHPGVLQARISFLNRERENEKTL